jgi:hypothetical protein
MLVCSLIVTSYFIYLGVRREWTGPLLWPVVVAHAVFTLLLVVAWLGGRARGRREGLTPIRSSV